MFPRAICMTPVPCRLYRSALFRAGSGICTGISPAFAVRGRVTTSIPAESIRIVAEDPKAKGVAAAETTADEKRQLRAVEPRSPRLSGDCLDRWKEAGFEKSRNSLPSRHRDEEKFLLREERARVHILFSSGGSRSRRRGGSSVRCVGSGDERVRESLGGIRQPEYARRRSTISKACW